MGISVSIIVPIYNVEKYIEKCAISLLEQDFDDIEYVFVNDCTPDSSIKILKNIIKNYPERQDNIKIINHKVNRGLGAARKTGLNASNGNYILHIDSDDWCELDMVSSLYKKAVSKNADIVICDYYLNSSNKQYYIKQNFIRDKILGMTISGELENNCWNKLIKRSLYYDNNIFPPTHISMAEDRYLLIRLISFADNVIYLNKALVHYRQDNFNSLTFSYNRKSLDDFILFINETKEFLQHHKIYKDNKENFYKMLVSHIVFFMIHEEDNFLYDNFPESMKARYIWSFKGSSFKKKFAKHLILVSPNNLTNNLKKMYFNMRR